MSNRETAINVLNQIPENRLLYVIDILNEVLHEKMTDDGIPEIEPDEWDLEMIARAEREDDGTSVPLEELMKRDGFTYADLQNNIQ